MRVGDLIEVLQRVYSFNAPFDHWEPICEGLLVDHFTDGNIDKGVACILDKTGAIQRFDLSQYVYRQAKKCAMFKVEVIARTGS